MFECDRSAARHPRATASLSSGRQPAMPSPVHQAPGEIAGAVRGGRPRISLDGGISSDKLFLENPHLCRGTLPGSFPAPGSGSGCPPSRSTRSSAPCGCSSAGACEPPRGRPGVGTIRCEPASPPFRMHLLRHRPRGAGTGGGSRALHPVRPEAEGVAPLDTVLPGGERAAGHAIGP